MVKENKYKSKIQIKSKFNRLTVIEISYPAKSRVNTPPVVKCLCDCGTIKELSGHLLVSNIVVSCGCAHTKFTVVPGDKFGKLTVVKELPKDKNKRKIECVCDCGTIVITNPWQLENKNTHCYKCAKIPRYKGTEHFTGEYLCRIRNRAKNHDIFFEITCNDLETKYLEQNGQCYYTGKTFEKKATKSDNDISVDRIDSSKGYTIDNIVLCLPSINFAKQSLSHDDFIKMCGQVISHFNRERDS
jgi:hypothetical protein